MLTTTCGALIFLKKRCSVEYQVKVDPLTGRLDMAVGSPVLCYSQAQVTNLLAQCKILHSIQTNPGIVLFCFFPQGDIIKKVFLYFISLINLFILSISILLLCSPEQSQ